MMMGVGPGHRPLQVVLLGLCLALLPSTASSVEPMAGWTSDPLLEAFAYVPSDGVIAVEFSDWAGLSPAGGSQLDRRDDWPTDFLSGRGVHETDLAWQLGLSLAGERDAAVLRLREGWDPELFVAQLEASGFLPEESPAGRDGELISFRPVPGLEVGLTLDSDGRTLILEKGGSGRDLAELAHDRDLASITESPFGSVAERLDGALEARIVAGQRVCSGTGAENGLLRGKPARLAHSVGRLRPYQALGVGYRPGEEAGTSVGRYVFDYERPGQARRDLEGRRTLMARGTALPVERAEVTDSHVLLEVGLPPDGSELLFDGVDGSGADEGLGVGPLFAICGPPPSPEAPPRRATARSPLFVGPATLALSGEKGIYAWDEVHFGAREVRLRAAVTAGREPCSVRLAARDAAAAVAPDDRSAAADFVAAPGETVEHKVATEVDYATSALRVDSTCESWSLRWVPVDDPDLPWTLEERFYPVRGATIAALVPQTFHVDDTWAAYTRWHTSWQFEWQESETACDITSGRTQVRADVIYPRWREPADAPRSTVLRWRRFMDGLTIHELGHITIALQGAAAIDEVLDSGISAQTCQRAERLANRAARRVHDRFLRLNDRYDRVTGHGSTQGTDLR